MVCHTIHVSLQNGNNFHLIKSVSKMYFGCQHMMQMITFDNIHLTSNRIVSFQIDNNN